MTVVEAAAPVWRRLARIADLPEDGDWLRTSLDGGEVFVQRVGSRFVCYDNYCPHRGFPLRNEDKGNGPIRCVLHSWAFEAADGRLISVPGMTEPDMRAMESDLKPLEIMRRGRLLFGRR